MRGASIGKERPARLIDPLDIKSSAMSTEFRCTRTSGVGFPDRNDIIRFEDFVSIPLVFSVCVNSSSSMSDGTSRTMIEPDL